MKKQVFLFLLLLPVAAGLSGCAKGQDGVCKGKFRWDVKTLTDTAGLALLNSPVIETTISQLITAEPPVKMCVLSKKDGRLSRFPDEKQMVRVKAFVTEMNIQKDQDYHIVLKSPDSKASLIAEIPRPDCNYLASFPVQREKFRMARKQGDSIYQIVKETKKPVLVEVTGITFWDAPHFWIRGSNKRGREIHPVLEIRVIGK